MTEGYTAEDMEWLVEAAQKVPTSTEIVASRTIADGSEDRASRAESSDLARRHAAQSIEEHYRLREREWRTNGCHDPEVSFFTRIELMGRGWTEEAMRVCDLDSPDDSPFVVALGDSLPLWRRGRVERAEDSDLYWSLFHRGEVCIVQDMQAAKAILRATVDGVEAWEPKVKKVNVRQLTVRSNERASNAERCLDTLRLLRYEATDYASFVESCPPTADVELWAVLAAEKVDLSLALAYPDVVSKGLF